MDNETINVKLFRYDRSKNKRPYYQTFEVPFEPGMSATNALAYMYQSLDGSFAYYDHAGYTLGICDRCTGKVKAKLGLWCQTAVEGNIVIEPLSESKVI